MGKKELGKLIENKRLGKGLSQRGLASLIGVSNTTINRIEKGDTENPDTNTLTLLSKHLGVELSDLLKTLSGVDNEVTTIGNPQEDIYDKFADEIIKALKEVGLIKEGEPVSQEAFDTAIQAIRFAGSLKKNTKSE